MKFRKFYVANGTVFSGWLPQPVPVHHIHGFGVKIQNKTEMTDPVRLLFVLQLFDDCGKNGDIIFFSVVSSYTRGIGIECATFWKALYVPSYVPDEFKSHFLMTRETCELFTQAFMPTERIALGNPTGRVVTSMCVCCK